MLEKLKNALEVVKNALIYVIGPLLAVSAYIYYLLNQNKTLKEEIKQTKAEEQLATTLTEKKEAQDAADQAEKDYSKLRDTFLKQQSSGGGKPDNL